MYPHQEYHKRWHILPSTRLLAHLQSDLELKPTPVRAQLQATLIQFSMPTTRKTPLAEIFSTI
jgi:hypothetical protein